MNKIVIVGHPASGYGSVLSLLQEYGMATALPSQREGLLPQAITAILCKAHKVAPIESVTDEEDFSQIEAAPVWQGMALDLMLGNLEQPLWGWADPQAIYALDYWEGLDPQLTFVLVYDDPHRVLMDAARGRGEGGEMLPSGQDLHRLLDNWVAYNGALLRFHLRHAGRSLLVHARQVQRATDRYVKELQPLLDTPLSPSPSVAALAGPSGDNLSFSPMPLQQELSSAFHDTSVEPQQAAALLRADPTERYLIDDVLGHHPAVMQLYAELQSAANLPLDAPPREAQGAAAAAWEALLRQRSFVSQVMLRLHGEVRRVGDEFSRSQLALQDEKAVNANALARLQEQSVSQYEKLRSAGEENELLLTQLHQVQEELERYYLRLMESDREVDALKFQLGSVQAELRASIERGPDLSIVRSRALLSILVRRLVWRMVPKSILKRRAKIRAGLVQEHELAEIRGSQWFDADWYLAMHEDVRQAGKDAAEHYHVHGWREGRMPGPGFDPAYYLATYPDVRQADIDPLLHFIRYGASEGRQPTGT
ncbi:hypothetical protein CSC70_12515 [Pseudoxanthomonas kalamensis DSM 18571]|uniref:hypothetical protein n=1 Tax=Pseudoxanthomonas kalamensis TaxID=289483 RepID=UPI001390DF9A|nr:hypothetical protein [Pseudoxanthomonas kalamensis]KAF1708911.1 hypothetical protein CSC70_12515 [Pseudoxanthomonas kalamensis DSM 18571]